MKPAAIRWRRRSSTESQRTKRARARSRPRGRRGDPGRGGAPGSRAPSRPRPCGPGGCNPDPEPDHHQQQVEADQRVDEPVRGPASTSRARRHRSGRRDPNGDEQQEQCGEAEQRAPPPLMLGRRATVYAPSSCETSPTRGVLAAALRDGHRQRHARQLLGRRATTSTRPPPWRPPGGSSTRAPTSSTSAASRPGRARMPSRSTKSCAAWCRCSRRCAGRRADLDRHHQGRGGARRRSRRRRRSSTTSPRARRSRDRRRRSPRPARTLCLMHMQGSLGRCRSTPRYDDVVAEVADSSRSGSPWPWRAGIPEEQVASTRGSASARRPTRTSS